MNVRTEQELVRLCLALMGKYEGLSEAEHALTQGNHAPTPKAEEIVAVRKAIWSGADPLGDAFIALRPATHPRCASC